MGRCPTKCRLHYTTKAVSTAGRTITYADFFKSEKLQDEYRQLYRQAAPHVPYAAVTGEFNWEARHRPLYYIIMAPLLKATDGIPFVSQIFVLRLASFLLAFAGYVIALAGTMRYGKDAAFKRYAIAGFLLYPADRADVFRGIQPFGQ